MKYGDFSSVAQLGVGLHVGTALLQVYGELGMQPLVRVLQRIRSLLAAPDAGSTCDETKEELARIESQYEIFKIQLFQEYRKYVCANAAIAVMLAVVLVALAYFAQADVIAGDEWVTILIVVASLFPAPITLLVLWLDANRQVQPMKAQADALESEILKGQQ